MTAIPNPEDQLRAMASDASRWELEAWVPDRRPSTHPSAPERATAGRWWAIGFSTVAVLVVAAIVLFVGVTNRGLNEPPPITTSTPSPAPTQTPTPEPTKTEAPAVARGADEAPSQLFDGSCDDFLDASSLGAAVGGAVKLSAYPSYATSGQRERYIVAAEHGGLYCDWYSSAAKTGVEFVVLPLSAVDPLTDETCADGYSEEFSGGGCAIAMKSSDIQVSGGVYVGGGGDGVDAHKSEAQAAATRIAPLVQAALAQAPTFQPQLEPTGTWDLSGQYCSAVDGMIDASDLVGKDFGLSDGGGTDSIPPPALEQIMPQGSVFTSCLWTGSSDFVSTQAFAGAAWLEPQIAAQDGVQELDVEGFDHAYLAPGAGGGSNRSLELFRGPNWLSVYLDGDQQASDWEYLARGVATALDARSTTPDRVADAAVLRLASASMHFLDADGAALDTAGYFRDTPLAIADLRAAFGKDPRIAVFRDPTHGDQLRYTWGGLTLNTIAADPRDNSFWVVATSATVDRVRVEAAGGIAVGDTVAAATAAYGSPLDGGGRTGSGHSDEWHVDQVAMEPEEWSGSVDPGQDLGDKWVLVSNDETGQRIVRVQSPVVEYSH